MIPVLTCTIYANGVLIEILPHTQNRFTSFVFVPLLLFKFSLVVFVFRIHQKMIGYLGIKRFFATHTQNRFDSVRFHSTPIFLLTFLPVVFFCIQQK